MKSNNQNIINAIIESIYKGSVIYVCLEKIKGYKSKEKNNGI